MNFAIAEREIGFTLYSSALPKSELDNPLNEYMLSIHNYSVLIQFFYIFYKSLLGGSTRSTRTDIAMHTRYRTYTYIG